MTTKILSVEEVTERALRAESAALIQQLTPKQVQGLGRILRLTKWGSLTGVPAERLPDLYNLLARTVRKSEAEREVLLDLNKENLDD